MKVGVFDSGKGGEFIANRLRTLLPEHEYVVVNDREHVPYGSRSDKEVAAISALRATYPTTKFVGIEPMVKPAALVSKTKRIAVLATPLTLQSRRYRRLVETYANGTIISEPNTAGWAAAIEYDKTDEIVLDELGEIIANGCDVVVLACTHYLALQSAITQAFPGVMVLEPSEAIARQIAALA